ncbi:MAG TPA: DUF4129 domain-containing protein [Jatrophihabitantaceae bacterium]|nr:DUF4129 domain-containing protein [Jatrophihabitantaceae bacterium]
MWLSGPGPVPSPVRGPDARQAVVDQLRKAEYHRDDQSFLGHAWDWLLDRLDALFSGSPGANTLLVLLVIVAAVVILAVVRAGVPRRTARRSSAADPLAPQPDVDHRQLALAFSARGQRAEALREWLRAAVAGVEERGVLLPRPGRTGAALAREAGPLLPDAAGDLAAAATAFDEVWFGGRAATDADVAAARSAAEAIDRATARRPSAVR